MTSNAINARANDLKEREIREKERSNRSKEDLTRRGQNIGVVTDLIGTAAKAVTGALPKSKAGKIVFGGKSYKMNAPSWYTQNGDLSFVGNLAFGAPRGLPLLNAKAGNNVLQVKDAGIMLLPFAGAIGQPGLVPADELRTQSFTVAAQNLYTFVRHMNSGSRNYDPADLFMFVLAMDDVYMLIAKIKRALSVIGQTDVLNRYKTNGLAKALVQDPTNTRASYANICSQLNQLILKAQSLFMPDAFTAFARHTWMSSVIIKESEARKTGYYIYEPVIFHYYDEANSLLQAVHIPLQASIFQMLTVLENMIGHLTTSESIGIMSGDLLKAYGEGAGVKISFIDSIAQLPILETSEDEVKAQINNLTWLPYDSTVPLDVQYFNYAQVNVGNDNYIYQGSIRNSGVSAQYAIGSLGVVLDQVPTDPGLIVAGVGNAYLITSSSTTITTLKQLVWTGSGQPKTNLLQLPAFVNFYKDEPTADEVIVATRGIMADFRVVMPVTPGAPDTQTGSWHLFFTAMTVGTEWFFSPFIVDADTAFRSFAPSAAGVTLPPYANVIIRSAINTAGLTSFTSSWGSAIIAASMQDEMKSLVGPYTYFDWAPRQITGIPSSTSSATTINATYLVGDIENVRELDAQFLKNLHSVAVLSEYNSPRGTSGKMR